MTEAQGKETKIPENSKNWLEVARVFLGLGLTSFGGPAAHISFFRQEFVEKRGWLSDQDFARWFAICQFLPGPASSQLGFVIGLLRAGWLGALMAFLFFTLPSVIILVFAAEIIHQLPESVFLAVIHGLKVIAVVVVAQALVGMIKSLWPDWRSRILGLLFVPVFIISSATFFQLSVLLLAGFLGVIFLNQNEVKAIPSSLHWLKSISLVALALFGIGVLAAPWLIQQPGSLGVFGVFYQAGSLVFGGGHVVLPLLEQPLIGQYWISEEVFIAGYGLAQALPGPLFSVAAYFGYQMEGGGLLTAIVALAGIFLPGFLLVIGVTVLWPVLSERPRVLRFINGINVAIVGLLIAVWCSLLLPSAVLGYEYAALIVFLLALTFWFSWSSLTIVAVSLCSSLVLSLLIL